MSSNLINEIKSRIKLSDFVSKYVKLNVKGAEKEGLCPFHDEDTPSFRVNDDKGVYHCFGCNESGNLFTFAEKIKKLDFADVVSMFAGELGISVDKFAKDNIGNHDAIERFKIADVHKKRNLSLLEYASEKFTQYLKASSGDAAAMYLSQRGIELNSIDEYKLGWSPWNLLEHSLSAKNFSASELQSSGLFFISDQSNRQASVHSSQAHMTKTTKRPTSRKVVKSVQTDLNSQDMRLIDRFGGRIIFPIQDDHGKVIAFGGRILPEDQFTQFTKRAKYINSAESELFQKRKILYGYFQALNKKRLLERKGAAQSLLIVEGYCDVLSVSSCENLCAVAAMGTAISQDQIEKAWKLDPCPSIVFDGDLAGVKAADSLVEKILPILLPGFSVNFILLSNKEDPSSIICNYGKDYFTQLVKNGQNLESYLWDYAARHCLCTGTNSTPEKRAAVYEFLLEKVSKITNESVHMFYQHTFKSKWQNQLFVQSYVSARINKPGDNVGDQKKNHGKSIGTSANKVTAQFAAASGVQRSANVQLRMIFGIILKFPQILIEVQDSFLNVEIADKDLQNLRAKMIEWESLSINDQDLLNFLKDKNMNDVLNKISVRSLFWHFPKHIREQNVAADHSQGAASESAFDFNQNLMNSKDSTNENNEANMNLQAVKDAKANVIEFFHEICENYNVAQINDNRPFDSRDVSERWKALKIMRSESNAQKAEYVNKLLDN
jgi:DNA primase